jgi:alpha-L-arabinofuranosidase
MNNGFDKAFIMTITTIVKIDPAESLHEVSPNLFGIFFEDINFSCDGGINANMVNNYSFDGVYLDRKKKQPVLDPLRFWHVSNGRMQSLSDDPLSANSRHARLTVMPGCTLENLGYNGSKANGGACAMSIGASRVYNFACYLRNVNFHGSIRVRVTDEKGTALTSTADLACDSRVWQKVECQLEGNQTGYGKLTIALEGSGSIDLDCIVLMDADTWNKDDPKWRHGKLRKDLVQALVELKPKFVRFPGGCIVEGLLPGNEYNWKDTVGQIHERKHNFNLWGEKIADGGYCQSYQVGFYEYFCLCEDLGAKPLPTLFAGLNCQVRGHHRIATGNPAFRDYVIQNYLDLIAFANGDPDTNEWACLRREMGHPAPFNLEMIGIGNENFGGDYLEKFEMIRNAIHEQHPKIVCVLSAGILPFKPFLRKPWAVARRLGEEILVDEHSYHSSGWFKKAAGRFDDYPRGKAKVYFGEYAANGMMAGKMPKDATANRYGSALAEAAFLTGVERNSDVVAMASYAPLFNLVESRQWAHNLINFNPAHVLLTANYFVQRMFSATVGEKVVAMQGDLPHGVYASATATKDRLIVKLVNTTAHAIQTRLNLANVPNGTAQVEHLQAEDLTAANLLTFSGEPAYRISPGTLSLLIQDNRAAIDLKPYGVYVLIADR